MDPQKLQEICEAVTIPVVAIGGINESNILQLSDTSIKGVAIVSAILSSQNIENSARFFRNTIELMVKDFLE